MHVSYDKKISFFFHSQQKLGINHKKSDIDYSIANRVNLLYKQAIFKFQDDLRFWIAYMKFCKHVVSENDILPIVKKL